MPVFKLCLKIFKKNAKLMSIYFGIFIVVSIIITAAGSPSEQIGFSLSKTRIAIFTEESTPLIDGLKETLADIAEFKDIEDSPEAIQDALYFGEVTYVLRINEGFSESFMKGEKPLISKTILSDASSSLYVNIRVEQYLNLAHMYVNQIPDITQEALKDYLIEDLEKETTVNMASQTTESTDGAQGNMYFYFNFLAYTFLFVIIIGVSTVMMVFNDINIKRRNACAPIPAHNMNLQFFMAVMSFTLISWLILVALSLFFGRHEIRSESTIYFIINSFVFAINGGAMSFLIGNFMKKREAISGVANILTLGSSFISGVFVPQEILSENVLKVASFLPTYWYVRGNLLISSMTDIRLFSLNELSISMMIQTGFTLAFFIIAMVVGKRNRLASQE